MCNAKSKPRAGCRYRGQQKARSRPTLAPGPVRRAPMARRPGSGGACAALASRRPKSPAQCARARGQERAPVIERADDSFRLGAVVAPRLRFGDVWLTRPADLGRVLRQPRRKRPPRGGLTIAPAQTQRHAAACRAGGATIAVAQQGIVWAPAGGWRSRSWRSARRISADSDTIALARRRLQAADGPGDRVVATIRSSEEVGGIGAHAWPLISVAPQSVPDAEFRGRSGERCRLGGRSPLP